MAGMFFKARPFGEFIKKHVYSLLIPFVLFYLLSYPVTIAYELWDYRSFDTVAWGMICDIFKVSGRGDYLHVNVPLWFLLCLFWVQIFYWLISKLPLWINVIVLASIWLLSDIISEIPSPLMINNAIVWTLYFGLGNLSGKYIVAIVKNKKNAAGIVILGIILLVAIDYYFDGLGIADRMFYALWCVVLLSAVSLLDNIKAVWIDWLGFFGVNTLSVLGFHIWILHPFNRIFYRFVGYSSCASAIAATILTAIISIPLILFLNKYFPLIVGKGDKLVKGSGTSR